MPTAAAEHVDATRLKRPNDRRDTGVNTDHLLVGLAGVAHRGITDHGHLFFCSPFTHIGSSHPSLPVSVFHLTRRDSLDALALAWSESKDHRGSGATDAINPHPGPRACRSFGCLSLTTAPGKIEGDLGVYPPLGPLSVLFACGRKDPQSLATDGEPEVLLSSPATRLTVGEPEANALPLSYRAIIDHLGGSLGLTSAQNGRFVVRP